MYKVYWTNEYGENCGQALDGLTEALALAEWARNSNNTFVTMVSKFETIDNGFKKCQLHK
jgi:hypothetical protein